MDQSAYNWGKGPAASRDLTNRNKSGGKKYFIVALALLLIAVIQFVYMNITRMGDAREWRMSMTGEGVSYAYNDGAVFYSHDNRFYFFCTNDEMKYMSSSGDIRWQVPIRLQKPIMVTAFDKVAVGEERSRHIYVFDSNGLMYEKSFDDPVLFYSINENGFLSVILQLEQGYAIHIYSQQRNTTPLYTNVIRDPLIHPVFLDVSSDGRFIAIALLDMNVRMNLRVSFNYVNQRDSATVEGLFAEHRFPGQIPLALKFMEDNHLLIITDEQIACFKLNLFNNYEERWAIKLHNKIDKLAFYGGSRFAFATGDRLLNDDNATEPGVVMIYSISGDKTGEFNIGRRATSLSMGWDSVIAGADRTFYAMGYNGSRLWEYVSLLDTRGFIFLDNTDTVLLIGATRADVLKRERVRAQEILGVSN